MTKKRNGKEQEEIIHESFRAGEGGDLFGSSLIPPTRYRCPEHGDLFADEVIWQADGQPHCPHCGAVLQKVDER